MKQSKVTTPNATQSDSIGKIVGLGILGSVVALVAIWLQIQGKQAMLQSAAPIKPKATFESARFRADASYLPNEPLLGFVEIPAGSFVMGSDPKVDPLAFENEQWSTGRNQGSVDLPAFYIARYEVTVAQFQAFVDASGFKAAQWVPEMPDHPATNVSWTDALAYARWLEMQLQQSPQTPAPLMRLLHDGWRISLPTEAQWEKAARSTDGRIYPWGNVMNREYANFRGTGTKPMRVGRYTCPECAYNLADMSGNVWELTRSAYQSYPFDPSRALNMQTDALFVMRGGSFNDAENTIRAAVRGGIDPGARRPFIGFRVVLTRD